MSEVKKKWIKREYTGENMSLDDETYFEIDEMVNFLNRAKIAGCKQVNVTCEVDEYSHYVESIYLQPFYTREETDKEYEDRMKRDEERKTYNQQRELETYRRLREKYGDNV